MQKKSLIALGIIFFSSMCVLAQKKSTIPTQYFALQGGLTLLEAPVIFYPNIGLDYSRTIYGNRSHQIAVNPQFQYITIPDIERKFLLSACVEYKFQPAWRLETNVFAGLNYQLRSFAYDRYEFKDGQLKNAGSLIHQVGPTVGFHLGYKVLKRSAYSLSPYMGVSFTKLRNSYTSTFTEGFVPTAFFGIKVNLNK